MREQLFRTGHRLPIVIQAEQAECGLACLAMVAGFHGRRTDLNVLRREHPVSSRGATLRDILETAEQLAIHTRAIRVDIDELKRLKLPAILHWDMAHYVVLKHIGRSGIVIHDPAVGRRRYPHAEVDRHFTGIALELTPGVEFRPGTQTLRSRLTELFERYPGFNVAVGQLFLLSLMLQIASIGSAFYMQLVIDEGLASQDRHLLNILAIAFLMLALTDVAMTYARAQVQLYLSNQVGFQMVSNVFHHLLSLPLAFFEKRHVGDLVSRFGSIREIRQILTEDLVTVVLDGLFAVVTLAVMGYMNAVLSAVVLTFVLVAMALRLALVPRIQALEQEKIAAEASMSSNLMENMRAVEVIKFYCRELPRMARWQHYYADQINAQVRLARFSINMDAAYGLLWQIENVVVIYMAALLVLEGQITIGFLTAFVALKRNFSESIRSFIDKLVQIRLVRLQLERVSDITCSEKECEHLALPALRQPVVGALTLRGVSYGYAGSQEAVLSNVDWHIDSGEVLALLGPSGSGKSTLIRIAAGLLQPSAGTVEVDGEDIRRFGVRRYRQACAGILQADQLFAGSIADNISLFDEQLDHQRLRRAAAMAHIADFIDTLPMGFNSRIGDMGSIMSVGQRQRILLARAFYRQPRILFLDEATANLDQETESAILKELAALDMTIVLVTHRREPVAIADRVFRCNDGTLEELRHPP